MNSEVTVCRHIQGDKFHDQFRVELADGRQVFAKTNRAGSSEGFLFEAASLEWLGRANAVPVPEVLAVNKAEPGFLILQWIEEGRGSSEGDEALGRSLARLHTAGAPGFGREDSGTTIDQPLPNRICDSWAEFYASCRLEPLAQQARDSEALPRKALAGIDRIIGRVDLLVGPKEPPARLHGDLWAGNRVVDASGQSWLVNPCALGGDRESELAMMRLFGGFSDACFAAYDELFPLADGWQRRVPLYQLAPLIRHAIGSGGHYVGRVEQALLQLR